MFSGIVELKSYPFLLKKSKDEIRITFKVPEKWKIEIGESINIDGVCTTVESISKGNFTVYYMHETLKKTILGKLSEDEIRKKEFNLEKSLTLNTLVGGHLVSGHVDTTSRVLGIKEDSESWIITFSLKPSFSKYIIYKGSICINGVSLTVTEIVEKQFKVSLIPHTLKVTNLGNLKKNDQVNLEVDLMAKYIEKLVRK